MTVQPPAQPPDWLLEPTGRDAAGTPLVDVPRESWVRAAAQARDDAGMDFFDWLSAVDQPDGEPAGVDVVLHVADSATFGGRADRATGVRRMLLRTRVPDADLRLPSLTRVWAGAAWHERETFEMFGVTFDGFDDGSGHFLRPLLLPDGFEGTPLRKAFVLAARASKPWPGAKEPGESGDHAAAPGRRKTLPPGVPDPAVWGPRDAGTPPAETTAGGEPPSPDLTRARAPGAARPAADRPRRAGATRVEEPGDD